MTNRECGDSHHRHTEAAETQRLHLPMPPPHCKPGKAAFHSATADGLWEGRSVGM